MYILNVGWSCVIRLLLVLLFAKLFAAAAGPTILNTTIEILTLSFRSIKHMLPSTHSQYLQHPKCHSGVELRLRI
jgi:hypothetical protein